MYKVNAQVTNDLIEYKYKQVNVLYTQPAELYASSPSIPRMLAKASPRRSCTSTITIRETWCGIIYIIYIKYVQGDTWPVAQLSALEVLWLVYRCMALRSSAKNTKAVLYKYKRQNKLQFIVVMTCSMGCINWLTLRLWSYYLRVPIYIHIYQSCTCHWLNTSNQMNYDVILVSYTMGSTTY